ENVGNIVSPNVSKENVVIPQVIPPKSPGVTNIIHTANVIIAITTTTGTKIPEICYTRRFWRST
ncbi:hypothetical protein ACT453_42160, partial [Bacillus sp. D-CC]